MHMRQFDWKSLTLSVALALAAVGTANLYAQDRPDDQHDQNSAQDHRAQPNDHAPARGDDDTIARYRKAHPGYAARCHDGFFTKTSDRSRACSKHGGIDTWLL
jgi:hypothetical protein